MSGLDGLSVLGLIGHLNMLASRSAAGFCPLSKCFVDNCSMWKPQVVYIDKGPCAGEVVSNLYLASDGPFVYETSGRAVELICGDRAFATVMDLDSNPFIEVRIAGLPVVFRIEHGYWFCFSV